MASPKTEKVAQFPSHNIKKSDYTIQLTLSDRELIKKLDMEHRAKLIKEEEREREFQKKTGNNKKGETSIETTVGESINQSNLKLVATPNPKAKLKVSHKCVIHWAPKLPRHQRFS